MLPGPPWPTCLESLARIEESSPNNSPPLACLEESGRGSVLHTAHTLWNQSPTWGWRWQPGPPWDSSPHYSGKVQKWSHIRGQPEAVWAQWHHQQLPDSRAGRQVWHRLVHTFPLQRPQPPAPETLTRAGGNPVQMGRLNPGSLGSTPLPSASPCRLPTSETGCPSCLLGVPASAAP